MPLYAQCGLIVVVLEGAECIFPVSPHTVDVRAEAHLRDDRVNLAIGIIVAEDLLVP